MLLAWCSCDSRRSLRPSPRVFALSVGCRSFPVPVVVVGVIVIGSSLAAACLSLPHRLGLRAGRGGVVLASPLCVCRAACRIVPGGSGGGVWRWCFLVPRNARRACLPCDGVVSPSSPVLFDKPDGAGVLRHPGGVGHSHRFLIGWGGGRFGSACFYPCRMAMPAMWC